MQDAHRGRSMVVEKVPQSLVTESGGKPTYACSFLIRTRDCPMRGDPEIEKHSVHMDCEKSDYIELTAIASLANIYSTERRIAERQLFMTKEPSNKNTHQLLLCGECPVLLSAARILCALGGNELAFTPMDDRFGCCVGDWVFCCVKLSCCCKLCSILRLNGELCCWGVCCPTCGAICGCVIPAFLAAC